MLFPFPGWSPIQFPTLPTRFRRRVSSSGDATTSSPPTRDGRNAPPGWVAPRLRRLCGVRRRRGRRARARAAAAVAATPRRGDRPRPATPPSHADGFFAAGRGAILHLVRPRPPPTQTTSRSADVIDSVLWARDGWWTQPDGSSSDDGDDGRGDDGCDSDDDDSDSDDDYDDSDDEEDNGGDMVRLLPMPPSAATAAAGGGPAAEWRPLPPLPVWVPWTPPTDGPAGKRPLPPPPRRAPYMTPIFDDALGGRLLGWLAPRPPDMAETDYERVAEAGANARRPAGVPPISADALLDAQWRHRARRGDLDDAELFAPASGGGEGGERWGGGGGGGCSTDPVLHPPRGAHDGPPAGAGGADQWVSVGCVCHPDWYNAMRLGRDVMMVCEL